MKKEPGILAQLFAGFVLIPVLGLIIYSPVLLAALFTDVTNKSDPGDYYGYHDSTCYPANRC